MSLERLQQFVTEANSSNSSNAKKLVIEKYPDCKEYWKYTYDKINYQYGVTSTNLKKMNHIISDCCPYPSIEILLEKLNDGTHTGHDAIGIINCFISDNPIYTNLIHNIIDRNLKTRTDATLINNVFPGTIPTFDVALAESYDDKTAKCINWKDIWLCSRKIDGCRCIAIFDLNGKVKFWSRSGKEFLTLGKVKEELESLNITNYVMDGEIGLLDENGNENFQEIMKYIRKKDYTIPNPMYQVFDGIPKEGFEATKWNEKLIPRLQKLISLVEPHHLKTVRVLQQVAIGSNERFEKMRQEAIDKGWEGLILRHANVPYEGKRSKHMLKVKSFSDAEYVVKSVSMGPFRFIDKNTGLEVEEQVLSRITIEHKGNEVGVGSGFSLDQRIYYHAHPEELIGKTVTVCYFEESKDENGKLSLRFPTIKHIYKEGRDA